MQHRGQFSVLLCDDDARLRTAMRTLMEDDGRFLVAGEASNGDEAVEQAKKLRPDLILLDATMPHVSGIDALPQVVEESPHSTVILLTAFSREAIEQTTVMEMDSLRGVYYMAKTRDGEEILDSIADLADASLSTSLSPAKEARARRRTGSVRERMGEMIHAMSGTRRAALAGFAVLALSSLGAFLAVNAQSARGSCVSASTPSLSGNTLNGQVSQSCKDSTPMYAFIQGRWGKASQVYVLGRASGGPLVKTLSVGTGKCPYTGTWQMWVLATRGLNTATSKVISYSCKLGKRRATVRIGRGG